LLRPMLEEAVPRRPDAEVALDFLENVDEAWGDLDAGLDRKAQPVRLSFAMVRILAEDHHPHFLERRQVERPEPLAALGKDMFALLSLFTREALQLAHL